MENTNLAKPQQVSEMMRQMITLAQTAGQYFTNDQIKEMTRQGSAEVFFFFLNNPAPPDISTLPLPAALPISTTARAPRGAPAIPRAAPPRDGRVSRAPVDPCRDRTPPPSNPPFGCRAPCRCPR